MSFMVDLRIDIRTKEMLNITPCKLAPLCLTEKGVPQGGVLSTTLFTSKCIILQNA